MNFVDKVYPSLTSLVTGSPVHSLCQQGLDLTSVPAVGNSNENSRARKNGSWQANGYILVKNQVCLVIHQRIL